ncbi:MAG: ABC transporter permease subunit, partial [Devosia sp.]
MIAVEARAAQADPGQVAGSTHHASAWVEAAVLHGFTLALLLGWWAYSQVVPAYQLPGPFAVAGRMGEFLTDWNRGIQLVVSLGHVCAAIALSFAIGAALALAAHGMGHVRFVIDNRLTPFLNAFSGIGWLFIAILWIGINSATVVFAVTMILLPFVIINLRTGLEELDHDLVELGRSLSRSSWARFAKILVPLLVPYLFAALRTSFGVAWKVTLTAELFGGSAGVGYLLNS